MVRSLGLSGPAATVTAGWREREPDDAELSRLLGGRHVNLRLYQRWLDVQDRDPEYAAGARRLDGVLTQLQDLYLLRLDYALRAVYALQSRGAGAAGPGADAFAEAVAAVRDLDAAHLRRVGELRGEFYQRWRPHDLPPVAGHRAAVAGVLGEAAAVVIAGGHVGVLADTLHLFNVAPVLRSPVIAWSAGAMALTGRIVLFNDTAPQGPGHPEVYTAGLSVLRGMVALPHASGRLLLRDLPRMALLARRFAPARCVLLDPGTRVDTSSDGPCPAGTRVIAGDGRVTLLDAA